MLLLLFISCLLCITLIVSPLFSDAFRKAMNSVSPDLSPMDIDQLFMAIDVDNDKQISFTEFLAATIDPREVDMDELSRAFKLLDSDNKGYLSTDDFYRVLAYNTTKNSTMQLAKRQNSRGTLLTSTNEDSSKNSKTGKKKGGGSTSSDEISRSGPVAGVEDSDQEVVYFERERTFLLQKIAKMVNSADLNGDGMLSYTEFLLGVMGNIAPDENTDGTEIRFVDKDIFDYTVPTNHKEKRLIRSLLSNSQQKSNHPNPNRAPFMGRKANSPTPKSASASTSAVGIDTQSAGDEALLVMNTGFVQTVGEDSYSSPRKNVYNNTETINVSDRPLTNAVDIHSVRADIRSTPRLGKFIRLPKISTNQIGSSISGPPSWISSEQ